MANLFMSEQPTGPNQGPYTYDEESAGNGSAAWSKQDYSWDPYGLTADSLKSAKGGLACATAAPAVNTRSSGRVHKEITHAPAGRAKGPLCCQVETCQVNLETSKEYHIRYRICETCLKTSSIVRDGERERFCQQCGRFHPLEDFDGDKRSCRVRLMRHNNRRRKKAKKDDPPSKKADKGAKGVKATAPTSKRLKAEVKPAAKMSDKALEETLNDLLGVGEMSVGLSGSTSSAQDMVQEGGTVSDMLSSHMMDDMSMQTDTAAYTNNNYPTYFERTSPPTLPFIAEQSHASSSHHMEDAMEHMNRYGPQPDFLGLPQEMSGTDMMMNPMSGLGLEAPSLPSFAPSSQMLHPMAPAPLMQPQQGMRPAFNVPGYALQVVPAGLTFEQLANAASHRNMLGGVPGPQMNSYEPMQLHPTGYFSQTAQGPAPVILAMLPAPQMTHPSQYPQMMNMGNMGGGPSIAHSLDSLDIARNVLSQNCMYEAPMQHMWVSAKINGITPDSLPRDLKGQLEGLVHSNPNRMEGYIRAGCVHLTVKFTLTKDQANAVQGLGARDAANMLLNRSGASAEDMWHQGVVLVKVHDEVALIRDGMVTHVLDGQASAGVFPNLEKVSPLAMLAAGPNLATLHGSNLMHTDNIIVGHCQGHEVLEQRVTHFQKPGALKISLPRNRRNGAVQMCVIRGCYQSRFKPVLIIDDEEVVKEINQLDDPAVSAGIDVDTFLMDLDSILELLNALEVRRSGSREAIRQYDRADYEILIETACRIFLVATAKGWPATARLVQPVTALYAKDMAEVVTRIYSFSKDSLSLLHLAVRSGNPKMVEMVMQWASRQGFEFAASTPGPAGLTPLHLAVLLPDGGHMAALLTVLCVDGQSAWCVPAADGLTPFQLAQRAGTAEGVQAMISKAMAQRYAAIKAAQDRANEGEGFEADADGSEVDVEEEEDDIIFETDPETGEVINLDGESVTDDDEEEEDEEEEEEEAQEPVLGETPVKPVLEMPAIKAGSKDASVETAGGAVEQQPVEDVSPSATSGTSAVDSVKGESSKDMTPSDKSAARKWAPGPIGVQCIKCGNPSRATVCRKCSQSDWDDLGGKMKPHRDEFADMDDKPLKGLQTKRPVVCTENQVVTAYGMGVAPTVFDRLSAVRSGLLISTIGCSTLFLRYYVDYFMD